jgi:hypothetical protein
MQAVTTSSDIDFAAVMKIATVALKLIGDVQCSKDSGYIRARIMSTAIMQAALAMVATHSQNQKSFGSFHLRSDAVCTFAVVSLLPLFSVWYSICSRESFPTLVTSRNGFRGNLRLRG